MDFNEQAIKQSMWEYASSVGFPLSGMSPADFLRQGHLEKMYDRLQRQGLVKPEWRSLFMESAKLHYQLWYMRNR